MFSTNTIAKLAGINNFVLNEANPSGSKYTDEQIIELFKKVELGIRQNDELFKLNKKFFGGIDKTAEEKAEEDQKKQEEKDKAHDEDEKAKADRDDKKSAESYDALKKQVREYFTDDSLYEYKHRQFFTSSISSSFNSIADKEQSLETKPFISKWLANGEEFVFIRRVLMSTVKAMADFINSGNGKFKAKDFGDYVNSLLQHQQIKQNVYEKTVDNYQALEAWTEANKDKPLIDVVNENKELIKLIIKKADFFAEDGSEPRPLYTIGRSTTFIPLAFTIFTRPSDNIKFKIKGCKFIEALEHANKGKNKIFIWNHGVYSAASLEDTINLSVILKGLTKKTLKQISNIALRSYGRKDFSILTKEELDEQLREQTDVSDLEDDILSEGLLGLGGRKITVDSLHKAWSEEGRPKTPAAFKEFIEDHLIIQFGEKHSRKISELLSKVLKAPDEQAPAKDEKDDPKTDTSKPKDDDEEPLLKPEEETEEKTTSDDRNEKEEKPSDGLDGKDKTEDTPPAAEESILQKFKITKEEYQILSKLSQDVNAGRYRKPYWKELYNQELIGKLLHYVFDLQGQDLNKPLAEEHNIRSLEDLDRAILIEQQCKLAGIQSSFNSTVFFEQLDKFLNQAEVAFINVK